ncbi:LPXTG cell wall anchor domain-containing protein [Isoptericola sp. 4D.3]|uniref:LPXTG cell wall anchor domain-containing protein n=1 Tax=Isoptericola peretonis TaxID=2918523 RepID=A0ABT0J3W7_9MICO|nr:LPXTG cell wall anchor domain-containing protein [Isoptericola sp. 4D.3]
MKRTLAGVVATMLAAGGMLVATAAPASAHTPRVEDTCSSLEVNLTQYNGAGVTVTIDGKNVADENFRRSWQHTFQLDGKSGHTWTVDVDAHDGNQFDWSDSGRTEPCTPTTPPQGTEVQVGIYLYPKLDKDKPAAWENSGKQQLLGTTPLTLPEEELTNDEHWYTELPETDALDDIDLCTGWGIQQDLVRGGPDDYTMPETITYPDGSSMDGHLVDWQHQELSDFGIELPGAEDCTTPPVPETPDVEEPQVVVPQAPVPVEVCGADSSDVILPADTEDVTYLTTEQGVLAVPGEGRTFGDDLGGYTRTEAGEVLFPITELLPSAEDCELVPGDIGAVCVGDTPYLDYGVSLPEGVEADGDTPLTITFLHPDGGEDYVATDQPLEGQLLWPGASDTAPKQWPGWEQQDDGSYTETDGNYAWTRDGVQVLFEVNPDYSTVVEYPEASTECANPVGVGGADVDVVADDDDVPPAETAEQADELPKTGATVGVFAGLAALLLVGGGVLFWLRRRIQH